MNLNIQAHEGHQAFIWPGTDKTHPAIYCQTCDVFTEVPETVYLDVGTISVHQRGTGPAYPSNWRPT